MKALKTSLIGMLLIFAQLIIAQPPGGGRQGERQGGQQGPPAAPTAKQITKMMTTLAEEISLSDEQKKDVTALYTEHFASMEEMTSGNNRPKREEMKALNTKLQTKVKALLDDEQIEKYEAYLKKKREERKR